MTKNFHVKKLFVQDVIRMASPSLYQLMCWSTVTELVTPPSRDKGQADLSGPNPLSI